MNDVVEFYVRYKNNNKVSIIYTISVSIKLLMTQSKTDATLRNVSCELRAFNAPHWLIRVCKQTRECVANFNKLTLPRLIFVLLFFCKADVVQANLSELYFFSGKVLVEKLASTSWTFLQICI